MNPRESYVRARIDRETKEQATESLEAMGLSVSEAIRLLMHRIAEERRLPFEIEAPNVTTREAIHELETGQGQRFDSLETLMTNLRADD